MSWKYVFNTSVSGIYWEDINQAINMAKQCGYYFITWNGNVYTIEGKEMSFKVKDLF